MNIKGRVDYEHLPYGEEGAFTFCNYCKETCERVVVEFHEGICSDWMVCRCSKCGKSIWTSKLKRIQTKGNKKCAICGQPTNWVDCAIRGGRVCEKENFWCSCKCYSIQEKRDLVVDSYLNELRICFEESGIEYSPSEALRIAKGIEKKGRELKKSKVLKGG